MQKGFLVLVGIRSVNQAKENLGALGWALTTAEVEALDRAAKKVPKQLIQILTLTTTLSLLPIILLPILTTTDPCIVTINDTTTNTNNQ